MRIILLGPPGSGKGTQSAPLAKKFSVLPLSTGEMLRSAIAQKTEIGRQVESIIKQGALIPDKDIVRIVTERLLEKDAEKGFVLDGFPRTLEQARALDSFLESQKLALNIAFEFKVSDNELFRRILKRSQDATVGGIAARSDDSREILEKRLEVYREETLPIVRYYAQQGILYSIDGMQSMESITQTLIQLAQQLPKTQSRIGAHSI